LGCRPASPGRNYKDALAITNSGPIVKTYPMVGARVRFGEAPPRGMRMCPDPPPNPTGRSPKSHLPSDYCQRTLSGGVDYAGTVVESRDAGFRPGDAVVMNGWGAGEVHWGGYSQYMRPACPGARTSRSMKQKVRGSS